MYKCGRISINIYLPVRAWDILNDLFVCPYIALSLLKFKAINLQGGSRKMETDWSSTLKLTTLFLLPLLMKFSFIYLFVSLFLLCIPYVPFISSISKNVITNVKLEEEIRRCWFCLNTMHVYLYQHVFPKITEARPLLSLASAERQEDHSFVVRPSLRVSHFNVLVC